MSKVNWPTKRADLVEAVKTAFNFAKSHRNPHMVEWYVNYWYLQGARDFITNYRTGRVDYSYETSDGHLVFKLEDLLDKMQKELGKFMRTNLKPVVNRRRLSLQAQADASMAQIALDELLPFEALSEMQLDLGTGLNIFGTMGVAHWTEADFSVTRDVETELIPPWQLLPVPGRPRRAGEVGGLMRHRKLPLDWLKAKRPEFKFPSTTRNNEMSTEIANAGDYPAESGDPQTSGSSMMGSIWQKVQTGDGTSTGKTVKDGEQEYVELIEVWLHDHKRRVCRYIAIAGDILLQDKSYEDRPLKDRPYMPINICRRSITDSFWGRSYLGPLLAINMQNEKMMANGFRNMAELDLNGQTFVPATWGLTRAELTASNRPKVHLIEQDVIFPNAEPKRLAPFNAGKAPVDMANFGIGVMDRLAGESPLDRGEAPGRVDGGPGLGMLWEAAGVRNVPLMANVGHALITGYKSLLQRAREAFSTGQTIQLSVVDDNLVGVQISPETGNIELGEGKNAIPHPDDVLITIAEHSPRMKEERMQQLMMQYDKQLISPQDFWWINFKENLGFMPGVDAELIVQTIQSCKWRNLIAWGDGKTPGTVAPSPYDDHETHRKIIMAFIARPIFELASPSVQTKFVERLMYHEKALGVLPQGMPAPEDAAAMEDQMGSPWGISGPQGVPPELMQQLQQPPPGAG